MKHTLPVITLLVFIVFTRCKMPDSTEKKVEERASKLADNIDSTSLNLLKKFNFGKRGDVEFWQRVSADSLLYSFSVKRSGDTTELIVLNPYNFKKDFTTNFQFDTSKYYQFSFLKVNDSIVKIVSTTNHELEISSSITLSTKFIFPEANPFETLSVLTSIKDKYSLIGTSYRSDIGDFIVFWLTPQFKLTYLPDTSNMNSISKKIWLDEFSKGKSIKEHWRLTKVYE